MLFYVPHGQGDGTGSAWGQPDPPCRIRLRDVSLYKFTNPIRDPNGIDHFSAPKAKLWGTPMGAQLLRPLGRWLTPDPAGLPPRPPGRRLGTPAWPPSIPATRRAGTGMPACSTTRPRRSIRWDWRDATARAAEPPLW